MTSCTTKAMTKGAGAGFGCSLNPTASSHGLASTMYQTAPNT